ncbi:MAG: porin family protein [Pseudolabrys sp.]|nr:porin family protein [Pseudolabrys sp.]
MRLNTAIAALLVLGATGTVASAADMPRPSYSKAPAYVAPAYYDWTGFYIGANAGYGWAPNFATDAKGFVGGGQLGYNWQAGSLVFGLEGDIQYTSLKSDATGPGFSVSGKIPAFATARGRLGYAFDRVMVYGTGGWAYTKTDLSLTVGGATVSDNKWSSGYALGGGVEWAVWDRWSVKAEYLYIHSGDVNLTLAGVTTGGSYNLNVARAGLNYRF